MTAHLVEDLLAGREVEFTRSRFLAGSRPFISGVYAIVCKANGSEYIGSSVDVVRRWKSHRHLLLRGNHHSGRLQRCFDKYGPDCFRLVLLEVVPAGGLVAAENRHFDRRRDRLLNTGLAAEAAMLGRNHTVETRLKMGVSRKVMKFSPEWRANMSAAKKGWAAPSGWHHSEETRRRISEKSLGKPGTMRGRRHTLETIATIAASNAARDHALRKRGAEHANSRAVEIDGIVYPTLGAAGTALGVKQETVTKRIGLGMGRFLDNPESQQTRAWGDIDHSGENHRNARAVYVGDLLFACGKDAARHFGISPSTLIGWLRNGKAEYADGMPPIRIGPHPQSAY